MEFIYIAKNSSFEFIKTYQVENSAYIEKHIHKALSNRRYRDDREFFNSDSDEQIIAICDELIADYAHFYLKRKYSVMGRITDQKQLAKVINRMRLSKGLTQEDLSIKTGISVATINRIENQKSEITLNALFKICEVLEIGFYCGSPEDTSGKRRRTRKYYNVVK